MKSTPTSRTQPLVGFSPMPFAPKSRNPYWPLTWARLAMTRTSEAMMPQPPSQPTHGPKVRVPQVNVVPQSGSALLSSLYPMDTKSMGTKASTTMMGERTPTATTIRPRVAARL